MPIMAGAHLIGNTLTLPLSDDFSQNSDFLNQLQSSMSTIISGEESEDMTHPSSYDGLF
jgi:hypothetical protein